MSKLKQVLNTLVENASTVFKKLASEHSTVTILDQEALGDSLVAFDQHIVDLDRCFVLSKEEHNAVKALATEQGVSEAKIITLALRHYQLTYLRLKDGETMSFSGDAQRAAEFAGASIEENKR